MTNRQVASVQLGYVVSRRFQMKCANVLTYKGQHLDSALRSCDQGVGKLLISQTLVISRPVLLPIFK